MLHIEYKKREKTLSYKSTVMLFLIIATKLVALHSVKKSRSDKMKRTTNLSRYNVTTLKDCTRIRAPKRLLTSAV